MEATATQAAAPPSQPVSPVESRAVAVEIYDQIYHLRGIDPAYIEQLARVVDTKMHAVSAMGNTVDSL
ncbi:MAG TPA: cell division protein ZapA, partial [Edaphobacter sp.]